MRHPPWNTSEASDVSPYPAMKSDLKVATAVPPIIDPESMRAIASWIRDDLDPLIASEGPDIMHPDDVLSLNELFQSLQVFHVSKGVIAFSRMHQAVREIAGKASRWPYRLVEDCDRVRNTPCNEEHSG